MGLRRYERAVGDAVPPITPKMPIFILCGVSKEMGVATANSEAPVEAAEVLQLQQVTRSAENALPAPASRSHGTHMGAHRR